MTGGAFWRLQQRRRVAVVCLYLGYLLVFLSALVTARGSVSQALGAALMVVSGLAIVFGVVGVLQSRRVLLPGSIGMLDERQQAVRDRAYFTAYRFISLLVVAGVSYLALVRLRRLDTIELARSDFLLLAGGIVLLLLTLPSAIMAWTEQDTPEDSGAHGMINRRSL
jgi:hypothetical protein